MKDEAAGLSHFILPPSSLLLSAAASTQMLGSFERRQG
jgi:hypothetical protein